MSANSQNDKFEQWLRKVCFQAPTPEAHDLAWAAWEAGQQVHEVKGMPLCPKCHVYYHLLTDDAYFCLNGTCSEYRR